MTKSSQHDPVTRPALSANSAACMNGTAPANGQGNRGARVDPKLRHYPESQFGGYSDIDQLVGLLHPGPVIARAVFHGPRHRLRPG